MQFLVIFTPKLIFETNGVPSDFPKFLAAEDAQVKVLYGQGGVRQVWALNTKAKGAALLFEVASAKELQSMIDSLPLVKVDYADYQIWPLAQYPGFFETA